MAMGILSDDDFLRELSSVSDGPISTQVRDTQVQDTVSVPSIQEIERPGRKDGDTNVPDSLRKVIGEEGAINGRQSALALARMFDVSSSSVSAYSRGATSTASYDKPKPGILEVINKSKERITRKAQSRIHSVLNHLTDDKLQESNAKELSSIAKDMSVVVKNMEPTADNSSQSNAPVTFVIMRPEMRSESNYPIIDLKES